LIDYYSSKWRIFISIKRTKNCYLKKMPMVFAVY
jgi:hypothetical protein